ncbi:MAG: DUF421 domain-containing protein [Phycisphaerales bacterium]
MQIFFDNWNTIGRTLLVGVLAYVAVVVFLRISGPRTLSKMNAFDFIVTIALGSTLATVLISKDVSLAQGVTALGLLITLQFVVTWSSARWRLIKQAVTGEPVLLLFEGRMLSEAMKRTRVTTDEIRSALRTNGLAAFEQAHAVVLETDGSFSVVPTGERQGNSTLQGVRNRPGS